MQVEQILGLLERINGCTFAALDAEFAPKPGYRQTITGEVVILFTNQNSSGYENMVKRRLAELGKDPDTFHAGPLPWGERVPNLPLIIHGGNYYLQTILLKRGETRGFIGNHPVDVASLPKVFDLRQGRDTHGLGDREVICRTYRLENLKELRLMHEKVTAEGYIGLSSGPTLKGG